MDDHQEEVLEGMANALVLCSRLLTVFALCFSGLTFIFVDFSTVVAVTAIVKACVVFHGLALLFNAFAHIFLGGDKRAALEARLLAGVNIAVLLVIAAKVV